MTTSQSPTPADQERIQIRSGRELWRIVLKDWDDKKQATGREVSPGRLTEFHVG